MDNQMYNQVPQNPAPKKKEGGLNGMIDAVAKFLPIITIVFIGIGLLGLCYYWLMGLINAIDYESFKTFLSGFVSGISCFARYAFYGVVTLGINKLIRK